MAVYVDTSAWIALIDPKDTHHERAKDTHARLRTQGELLVTGRHTLVEFIDGLEHHTSQKTAARTLRGILTSQSVQVEPSEPALDHAVELFTTHTDWNVDLSDCLSFCLMQMHTIRRAFTYDQDFAKAGYETVG